MHHHAASRSALWFGVGVVLWLSGCDCSGPTGDACERNSDCEEGEVCTDGTCVPRVETDAGPNVDGGRSPLCEDLDRDGYDAPSIDCPTGDDCDDTSNVVRPGAAELCGDGVDNDCDGTVDEPDCDCERGDRLICYEGPADTAGVGTCRRGVTICIERGMTGECRGQVLPVEEACDGTDEDCDGTVDEGLRNACGECAVERTEMCGNEVDDDCDGLTDEDCDCDYRCGCAPATSCECEPPTNQPCYDGPFGTGGTGICAGGRRDCVLGTGGANRWGACVGQTLPGVECDGGAVNGEDDDCDGVVDEGCADADGDGAPWPADCDDGDAAVGPGSPEVCNGRDDNCNGVPDEGVTNGCGGCGDVAATDECGNGLDADCDGVIDDGCSCTPGDTGDCYGGPEGTMGVGECRGGTHTCEGSTEFPAWGACGGQVLPLPEICNGVDDDCDGEADERWAAGSNACGWCDPTEICDGIDQDCDGVIDEGVSNACGDCGPEPVEACNGGDDDCDGEVDEGVVNACGTCPPEPCFTETWPTPADCEAEGRFCDDVEEHPDYPGSVTLGQSTLDFDYIYIAVTNRNEVAQINTAAGPGRGDKNWQVNTWGVTPSRTAVAGDGSVWVTNRGLSGNAADVRVSNVVHLNASDGSIICRANVPNIARSVAIDPNGNIWAGSYSGGSLYHISGTMVVPAAPGTPAYADGRPAPPVCVELGRVETNVAIYGLTADPDGYVWTASSPTVRVNISDYSMTGGPTGNGRFPNTSHYGIAPDGAGRVWFGGHNGGGPIHYIDRATGLQHNALNGTVATAVTVHPDGTVWGSAYNTNQIIGINPATMNVICTATIPSGNNPHGIAVDRAGLLWMPSRFSSGTVNVYNTACAHQGTYVVDSGQELYSYSDMTGHLLRTFVSPEGRWQQTFDSGYALAYWTSIDWTSIEPPGTEIEVLGRTADTIAGLDAGVACGPFTTSPADLSGCPAGFQNHRYMRVETRLLRSGTDERPILQSVSAHWAY